MAVKVVVLPALYSKDVFLNDILTHREMRGVVLYINLIGSPSHYCESMA